MEAMDADNKVSHRESNGSIPAAQIALSGVRHGIRIQPSTSPPKLKSHDWKRGDFVRFCSKRRPDLLPADSPGLGVVDSTGLFHVAVRFDDFPDEVVTLAPDEVKRPAGLEPKKKSKQKAVDKSEWLEW